MNIFLLPIGFKAGGWLFSPIALIISCFFETLSAIKLSEAAHKVKIYNYPDLVEYCFGKKWRVFFQVLIAILCFQFTFGPVAFLCKTLQSITRVCSGETVTIWVFYVITILILAPLAWIRTLESLRYGFIFGTVVIFSTVLIVAIFDIIIIENEHNGEAGPEWQPFNEDNYWTMIALSFYMFEGIPTVLPIMETSDAKENFHWIVGAALATLCAINIAFSELCYYTFGDDIKEPIIILQMPEENPVIITDKILFCIMIGFSYPLIVYACNQVIESFIFSKMEYSSTRKWLKNLSRTINLSLALLIAITFYYSLHKILGFSAVIFGTIIVLIFPALIHNKISAETSF